MIICKLPHAITPMFSRGANLSGSEVPKVAVRNGMNGEFTRINCEKLRSETQRCELTSSLRKPPTPLASIRRVNLVQIANSEKTLMGYH